MVSSSGIIKVDSGFSDANFRVGCQVKGGNFGEIDIIPKNGLVKIGEIQANASGMKSFFVNIFFVVATHNSLTSLSIQVRNSGGQILSKISIGYTEDIPKNFVLSFQANSGETYYLYTSTNRAGSISPFKIVGLGFGGQCEQGKYDWVDISLTIYQDVYNGNSSTLPSFVGLTIYYQGLPTILTSGVGDLEIVNTNDIGKDVSVSAKLQSNNEGVNYVCDQQLNARIKLIQNDFYGKYDLFNEAKLYFHIGGNDYFGIDLLSTQVSSNPILIGQAVLPSGSYNDAAYLLKVNPKKIVSNAKYVVKAGLHLWYESGFPNLCG